MYGPASPPDSVTPLATPPNWATPPAEMTTLLTGPFVQEIAPRRDRDAGRGRAAVEHQLLQGLYDEAGGRGAGRHLQLGHDCAALQRHPVEDRGVSWAEAHGGAGKDQVVAEAPPLDTISMPPLSTTVAETTPPLRTSSTPPLKTTTPLLVTPELTYSVTPDDTMGHGSPQIPSTNPPHGVRYSFGARPSRRQTPAFDLPASPTPARALQISDREANTPGRL